MNKIIQNAVDALEYSKNRITNLSSFCTERDWKQDNDYSFPKLDKALADLTVLMVDHVVVSKVMPSDCFDNLEGCSDQDMYKAMIASNGE